MWSDEEYAALLNLKMPAGFKVIDSDDDEDEEVQDASKVSMFGFEYPKEEKGGLEKDAIPDGFTRQFDAENLPASVDWREKKAVSAVQNQHACGTSWAYMANDTLESAYKIAGGVLVDLSEQ